MRAKAKGLSPRVECPSIGCGAGHRTCLSRVSDLLSLADAGTTGHAPRWPLDVDAFLGQYKDIQTQDILTFCATSACTATYTDLIIFNVGKATIKGVELESALKPVDALGWTSNIRTNRPDNLTLGATLQARFIPSSFANTTLSANYAYRSRTVGVAALGVYKTPSFGVANARLTFENLFGSHFSLAFWGSNLTDRQFALACADNRSSIGYANCKWGEPRTFGATMSAALR